MVKMWENWYIWIIKSKYMPVDISKLQRMKKLVGPKTEGPKKYVPKIQEEVEIKGETSWGGESPMEYRNKLNRQLAMSKQQSRMLKEKLESGKGDWTDKLNLKGAKESVGYTRERLKMK